MKTTLIRAFVLTLALAGFGASTAYSHASQTVQVKANSNVVPPPVCPLNDPDDCGLD